ncbi:ABC transporter ATP-binding protein [uncultured Methanolobus sp.]|uniref:ABC transporter ATP-binding protein n=1 Tax=uncultured Methanolobus sp. TaxID=218300 RepID=UPI002AAB9CF8|nr:ABC transporter ATP-binding protein [uncultured Methanolobus sp.]
MFFTDKEPDGISIQNISLGYDRNLILNKIDFTVKKGSVVTLVGPNGCGKTTLLKIINGFLKQHGGAIYIDGKNAEEMAKKERAKTLSHVSQNHKSSFPFSVLDVVLTGRMPYISTFSTPGKEDIDKTYSVLEYLGIKHFADRPYTQISGGERQLVMIAKALAQEPDFLLLDEPTSFLDLKNQIHVLKTITDLSRTRNITVLMTLHDPNHAMLFSDEIILLRKLEQANNTEIILEDLELNPASEYGAGKSLDCDNIVVSGVPENVMTPEKIMDAYGVHVDVFEHKGKKMIIPVI